MIKEITQGTGNQTSEEEGPSIDAVISEHFHEFVSGKVREPTAATKVKNCFCGDADRDKQRGIK